MVGKAALWKKARGSGELSGVRGNLYPSQLEATLEAQSINDKTTDPVQRFIFVHHIFFSFGIDIDTTTWRHTPDTSFVLA